MLQSVTANFSFKSFLVLTFLSKYRQNIDKEVNGFVVSEDLKMVNPFVPKS